MKKTHWLLGLVALLAVGFTVVCGGVMVVGSIGTAIFAGPTVVEAVTATYDEPIEVIDEDGDGVDDKTPGDPRCREDVPHCMKVREARARITPMDEDILEYATKAYNKGVPSHVPWAKRCVAQTSQFERIERKTLFPLPLIMGLASHESIGCRMIKATNGDGGTGYMQVTNAPKAFKQRAAAMLGLKLSQLNLNDPVHNVAVGMVIWDDCEVRTQRRDIAALCYNRGIGAVNAIAPWAKRGWEQGEPYPHFRLMFPYINTKVYPTTGPVARRYTGEILAHMAMVAQLMRGEEPKDIPSGQLLSLNDLPFDPSHDGDKFVEQLVAGD